MDKRKNYSNLCNVYGHVRIILRVINVFIIAAGEWQERGEKEEMTCSIQAKGQIVEENHSSPVQKFAVVMCF